MMSKDQKMGNIENLGVGEKIKQKLTKISTEDMNLA